MEGVRGSRQALGAVRPCDMRLYQKKDASGVCGWEAVDKCSRKSPAHVTFAHRGEGAGARVQGRGCRGEGAGARVQGRGCRGEDTG